MDFTNLTQKRDRLEQKAYAQIQDAMKEMKGDIDKANKDVKQQIQDLNEKDTQKEVVEEKVQPSSDTSVPQPQPSLSNLKSPLIYFSYPISGHKEQPAWVDPLRRVLNQAGYLVYNPWDKINEQFGQQDLPSLNVLSLKLIKSLCPVLKIPEEVLLPFDAVWKILQQGDDNDNFGIVFQCLWFLVRSSLVVCDLIRPMAGAGVGQELLYSKQLNIPIVGLLSTAGQLNPFVQNSTTVLFSDTDLISLLPIIKGYAPIS